MVILIFIGCCYNADLTKVRYANFQFNPRENLPYDNLSPIFYVITWQVGIMRITGCTYYNIFPFFIIIIILYIQKKKNHLSIQINYDLESRYTKFMYLNLIKKKKNPHTSIFTWVKWLSLPLESSLFVFYTNALDTVVYKVPTDLFMHQYSINY